MTDIISMTDGLEDVPEDFDDFADDFDELEEFDPADDCMLGNDGQCMAAGSEWCEFECPYRDSELFAGSRAWREKHEKAKP